MTYNYLLKLHFISLKYLFNRQNTFNFILSIFYLTILTHQFKIALYLFIIFFQIQNQFQTDRNLEFSDQIQEYKIC